MSRDTAILLMISGIGLIAAGVSALVPWAQTPVGYGLMAAGGIVIVWAVWRRAGEAKG